MKNQRLNRTGKFLWHILPITLAAMLAGCGNWKPSADASKSLEIVPADLDVVREEQDGSLYVHIGSLFLSDIPPGWKMEQREGEEGTVQYVLSDVHSECESQEIIGHKDGYEHEILITAYKVEQMPELSLQLGAEMREYFSVPLLYGVKGDGKTEGVKGCWMYGENRETQEKEYFLFSENEAGEKELFHIREGNINVTAYDNEEEGFWDFMNNGLVWADSGKYKVDWYTSNDRLMEYYFLLNEDTEDPLLMTVQSETQEIAVYRKGDYETPVSRQEAEWLYPEWIAVTDIDRDGYEDFLCRYWLLDPAYSIFNTEKEDFEGYLWNKESSSFSYVSGTKMLEQYGGIWAERLDQSDERRGEEMVPEELIGYLSEYLQKSREEMRDAMALLVSDRELSMKEVKKLAKENAAIKREMLKIAATYDGSGVWLAVDADNDGIEDIFLCEYLGGSLGAVYYYLFSGTQDGHYNVTEQAEELKKEFAFINWQGKNYLAKTTWEFTKKEINGISLECYKDGTYQGGVWLAVTEKEGKDARDIRISYDGEGEYSDLASRVAEFAEKYHSGERVPAGTAEEEAREDNYRRYCDIDNDGEAEAYNASLWQTTNYYTADHLSFEAEDEELEELFFDMAYSGEAAGILLNMWVDETEYGNVTYVLYEQGLYDFCIFGYLLSEDGSRKVLQVDCRVQTEVTPKGILKSEGHGLWQ